LKRDDLLASGGEKKDICTLEKRKKKKKKIKNTNDEDHPEKEKEGPLLTRERGGFSRAKGNVEKLPILVATRGKGAVFLSLKKKREASPVSDKKSTHLEHIVESGGGGFACNRKKRQNAP